MYAPLFSLSGRNVAPNNSAKITPPGQRLKLGANDDLAGPFQDGPQVRSGRSAADDERVVLVSGRSRALTKSLWRVGDAFLETDLAYRQCRGDTLQKHAALLNGKILGGRHNLLQFIVGQCSH